MENNSRFNLLDSSFEMKNLRIQEGFLLMDSDSWKYSTPSPFENDNYMNISIENLNKTNSVVARDEDLAKIEIAILALIFILTVIGNCVVVLGIFFRRQKMSRMYYFILHLSFADLITAFFNVLTQLFWEITYRFQGGNFLCKFVKYSQILGPYSSSYVLVMTALDRYQAICYPLSNCSWTAKRSKIMLAIAWAISAVCCIPQLFIFSYQLVKPATHTEPEEYDCWGTFPENGAKIYVTWYSITVFIIPLIILVFAYTCITRAIWINFNLKAAGRYRDNFEGGRIIGKKARRKYSENEDETSRFESSVAEPIYHSYSLENGKNKRNGATLTKKYSTASSASGVSSNGISFGRKGSYSFVERRKNDNIEENINSGRGSSENFDMTSVKCKSKEEGFPFSSRKSDVNEFDEEKNGEEFINGNVKSAELPNICRHGCFQDRCNSCRSVETHQNPLQMTNQMNEKNVVNTQSESNTAEYLKPVRGKCSSFKFTSSHHSLLPNKRYFSVRKETKNKSGNVGRNGSRHSIKSSTMLSVEQHQPRTHSVKGISRAKIKTIKLTVTIICCYIFCSSPFIAAQLWSVYDPNAYNSPFFTGPTFTILTLLASLNSCVNPYIFLFFNPNLLENCFRGLFRPRFPTRRHFHYNGSVISRSVSESRGHLSIHRGNLASSTSGANNVLRQSSPYRS